MNEKKIITELLSIEAFASELKLKAAGLREELGRFHEPIPPKGAKSLTQQQINNLLIKRKNRILHKKM